MSSAPDMAPPGVQQYDAQANRPSGLPPNFQPPANMPNINFNAPVIRLGTGAGKPGTPAGPDADRGQFNRSGLGMDRGGDSRQPKEITQVLVPPTSEEKVRTLFVHEIPESLSGHGIEKLLSACGKLRRFDAAASVTDDHKGVQFGFALFDDPESLSTAVKLLQEQTIEVPAKRQPATANQPDDRDGYEGIEKTTLQVSVDDSAVQYLESYEAEKEDTEGTDQRLGQAKAALKQIIRELFYPLPGSDTDADVVMKTEGGNVEVVNITVAQDDELSDIPAEMREIVAGEIAAFRERSTQRDLERLRKEEEMEELERRRNGARPSRLDSPPAGAGANNIPLGPRGMANAPTGPKGQMGPNRTQAFVNGGISNAEYSINREDEETDADDEEVYMRHKGKKKSEEEKAYSEAERKWVNRERSRQAALERERDREQQESETFEKRKQEQLEREKAWDDEREASRKSHPYYRDRSNWAQKRDLDRVEEEQHDEADRRAEQDERRRDNANQERARGMADSFLDRQAQEMDTRRPEVSAPQPFKLSLGAAAQKAQASKAGVQRRTIAEVEGLLDDEEADTGVKRQLIPIQYDASSATANMTDEEISNAVKALAQEIPSDKDGLWGWQVKWNHMDESVVRDKLRPFIEKKIIEYLGVQEEMLVETVEEHLKNHGSAAALADELEGVCLPLALFMYVTDWQCRPSTTKLKIWSRSSGAWSSSLPSARSAGCLLREYSAPTATSTAASLQPLPTR